MPTPIKPPPGSIIDRTLHYVDAEQERITDHLEKKLDILEERGAKDDTELLTADSLKTIQTKKRHIQKLSYQSRDNLICGLVFLALAVASAVLVYFFPGIILLGIAVFFAALSFSQLTAALALHVQYSKNISKLAAFLFPIRHQVALVENFKKNDGEDFDILTQMRCKDLHHLSIASRMATLRTDQKALSDVLAITEEMRPSLSDKKELVESYFKATCRHLVDNKNNRAIAAFYRSALDILSKNQLNPSDNEHYLHLLLYLQGLIKNGASQEEISRLFEKRSSALFSQTADLQNQIALLKQDASR
jgi:hypothetical protein